MKEVSASAYAAAGVDLNAAAEVKLRIASIAESTYARGVISAPGGFGGVFDADAGSDYLMVSSTDSVGTKLRIAQAMQKHDTIGVDIVNHWRQRHFARGRRADVLLGLHRYQWL